MSMKLLPAAMDPIDPLNVPDASNKLVPLGQRAIGVVGDQSGVFTADAFPLSSFTLSSRNRAGGANWIDAVPVEDSESDEAGRVAVEYVSGWDWGSSLSIGRSVIAHYLSYAAGLMNGRGRLVDLYA
jgi:hypothetical protein